MGLVVTALAPAGQKAPLVQAPQDEGAVPPELGLKVPGAQGAAAVTPAWQKLPGGHRPLPVVGVAQKLPAAHRSETVRPVEAHQVPRRQAAGSLSPVAGQ